MTTLTPQQAILKARFLRAGHTKNTVINTGAEDDKAKPVKRKRRTKKDGKQ